METKIEWVMKGVESATWEGMMNLATATTLATTATPTASQIL
jgi:hypothetical protein